MTTTNFCLKCVTEKPSGVQCPSCKKCKEQRRYAADPHKILARNKKWRKDNPEKRRECDRAYYANNQERIREKELLIRSSDRERFRRYSRNYYARNSEKRRLEANEYKKKNPDIVKSHVHRRRALLLGSVGIVTPKEWAAIKKRQGGRCFDCGEKRKLEMGHAIPLVKRGCNLALNIIGQCRPCNSKQGSHIHPQAVASLFDRIEAP